MKLKEFERPCKTQEKTSPQHSSGTDPGVQIQRTCGLVVNRRGTIVQFVLFLLDTSLFYHILFFALQALLSQIRQLIRNYFVTTGR